MLSKEERGEMRIWTGFYDQPGDVIATEEDVRLKLLDHADEVEERIAKGTKERYQLAEYNGELKAENRRVLADNKKLMDFVKPISTYPCEDHQACRGACLTCHARALLKEIKDGQKTACVGD